MSSWSQHNNSIYWMHVKHQYSPQTSRWTTSLLHHSHCIARGWKMLHKLHVKTFIRFWHASLYYECISPNVLVSCARLSWSHSAFESMLNCSIVLYHNVDIRLQSGQFWATSVALIRGRGYWISGPAGVFIHIVQYHPSGLLQFSEGNLLRPPEQSVSPGIRLQRSITQMQLHSTVTTRSQAVARTADRTATQQTLVISDRR